MTTMTSEEMRTFIERFVDVWETENLPALLDCYAENARIDSPMFHTIEGRVDIEKSFENLFGAFADSQFEIEEVIVDREKEDRAVMVFSARGTHRGVLFGLPGTGRRVQISRAFILKFENGRILSERRLYDFTGLLVQLGVLKARAV